MATKTIFETLGELPSGETVTLTPDQLTRYLLVNYLENDSEKLRQKSARERLRLYWDDAKDLIEDMILDVFKDLKVRSLRKELVKYALFQNITKRIVNEISTVYFEAATRRVQTGQDAYKALQELTRIDRKLRKANRYTNLLNECLVMYRIRQHDRVPVLDVITPDKLFAVSHPNDPLDLVAVIYWIRSNIRGVKSTDPHWLLWSEHETMQLDERGRIVTGTYKTHNFGRIPGVLIHREEPDTALLTSTPGHDLVSAHFAVALLNVMMIKGQKSGTKVPYVIGDVANTPTQQTMDEESLTVFGEGLTPGTLELGSDPGNYVNSARAVIKQIAANYGIPEAVFDLSYQATSGFEIELKRVALREKRREQIVDYRPAERDLADVMSLVTASDLPSLRFNTDRWMINFGDVESPQDPMQRIAYWKELRQMGLTSTIDIAQELNPEFSEDEAALWIEKNIALETQRVALMRAQQAMGAGPNSNLDENDSAQGGVET